MPRDRTPAEQAARKERLRLDERERRASAVGNSLGSLAIEGFDPGPEARAIFQRYIDGELTVDEVVAAVLVWPRIESADERPKA